MRARAVAPVALGVAFANAAKIRARRRLTSVRRDRAARNSTADERARERDDTVDDRRRPPVDALAVESPAQRAFVPITPIRDFDAPKVRSHDLGFRARVVGLTRVELSKNARVRASVRRHRRARDERRRVASSAGSPFER